MLSLGGTCSGEQWHRVLKVTLVYKKQHLMTNYVTRRPRSNTDRVSPKTGVFSIYYLILYL